MESGRSEGLKVAKDGQKVPKVAEGEVSEHVPDIARDQRKLLAAIGDPVGVDSDLLKVHQDLSVAPRFLAATSWPRLGTGTLVHKLVLSGQLLHGRSQFSKRLLEVHLSGILKHCVASHPGAPRESKAGRIFLILVGLRNLLRHLVILGGDLSALVHQLEAALRQRLGVQG